MPETQNKQVTVKLTAFTSTALTATAILAVLKLAGVLLLSWWWVFAPLLFMAGLSVVGMLVFIFIGILIALFGGRK